MNYAACRSDVAARSPSASIHTTYIYSLSRNWATAHYAIKSLQVIVSSSLSVLISAPIAVWRLCLLNYHPRSGAVVFSVASVCLSVCLSLCVSACNAVTFESLNLGSSFLLCTYTLSIVESSARSSGQGHRNNKATKRVRVAIYTMWCKRIRKRK